MITVFTDARDPSEIERHAAGLTEEEVLSIWHTSVSELGNDDLDLFRRSFIKGRAVAKSRAVDSLFQQMNGKSGAQACLSYLTRMADEWPTVTEEKSPNEGRTFRIEMG